MDNEAESTQFQYAVTTTASTNVPARAFVMAPSGEVLLSVHGTTEAEAEALATRVATMLSTDDEARAYEATYDQRATERLAEFDARQAKREARKQALLDPNAKPLRGKPGKLQIDVLRCLIEHGKFPGGWTYGSYGSTIRTLDRLVARKLVRIEPGKEGMRQDTYYPIEPMASEWHEANRGDNPKVWRRT